MKIIAIGNQKGGVGKTTTAINFSAGLAMRGKKVLLLDLDPQANATSGLGVEGEAEDSMYLPLLGQAKIEDKIKETSVENLFIVPGHIDLSGVEIELSQMEDRLTRLRTMLNELAEKFEFDYCILDTPPSLGVLMTSALAGSDEVIIPLQCEWFGLTGLAQIVDLLKQIRESGVSKVKMEGILMTMYDGRTNLSRDVVTEVKNFFPDDIYKAVIPRSIKIGEAPSHGHTIFKHDANGTGAKAYDEFTDEFVARQAH